MPVIYMVRHGRVLQDPGNLDDPALSPEGHSQAARVAQELNARLPSGLPVWTSPMQRCRQTAAPLLELWQSEPRVEPRLAEVPGPHPSLLPRREWLQRSMIVDWPELIQLGQSLQPGYEVTLTNWRTKVVEAVLACQEDTVMFSHFVPVNVLAGTALGSQRVACFRPDHTSVTIFETQGARIRLLERGREMATTVS
ncbi:MAG TPA: histidine phosphatase family protein [Steroidobacteraceae bacterium]|nr:histidine phosphatase family protein [Steroidobacteraceae bacterium]